MQRIDHSNTSILIRSPFYFWPFSISVYFFSCSLICALVFPYCLGPCRVPITWSAQIVAMNSPGWMPLFREKARMPASMRLSFTGDSP